MSTSRPWSLRRKILIALLGVLVLIPSSVLYWVATTEAGLRFLVERARKVGPVEITAEGVAGTLTGGVSFTSLRVLHRLSDVRVENAQGRVRLLPLMLNRHIDVPALTAQRVTVTLLDDPVQRPERPPRFLPDRLRIDGNNVQVGSLQLVLKSGRPLDFSNIAGQVTLLQKRIVLRDATVDWEDWHFTGDSTLHAARPYGLEGSVNALWTLENQPEWRMSTTFDGDLEALPYQLTLTEPFLADATGNAVLQSGWEVRGHAVAREFDLTDFGGSDVLGLLSGELDVHVDEDAIRATGKVTPPGLAAGAFDVDFNGWYANKTLTIRNTRLAHPPSGSRADVRGTVTIEQGGPRLALNGSWAPFRWPLLGDEPAFTSAHGQFQLQGSKPWQVQGEGEILAADIPAFPARVRGELSGEAFRIDEGILDLLGGQAHITGEARWNPSESWRVQGRMSGLDAAQLRADLPGSLDFDFTASGAPFGEAGNIDFAFSRLDGRLRAQRARGQGVLLRAGNSLDWQFRDVDVSLGNTRVQLDGGLGDTPDLRFTVKADDLSLFDPEARGRIEATGHLGGARGQPVLQLKAQGSGFEWDGYELASLTADVDVDLADDPGRAAGSVVLRTLKVGDRTIDSARLALSGAGGAQNFDVTFDAAPLTMRLVGEGGLQDGLWQGAVKTLTVQQTDRLSLRNEDTVPLAFNLQQLRLGDLCLVGAQERMCVTGERRPTGDWNAVFSADMLPLSTFTAGMSQTLLYDGTIDLHGALNGSPGMLPTGSVESNLANASLRHRLANGREEVMALGTGRIVGYASPDSFEARVELDAGSTGRIFGRLDGQRGAANWRNYPIRGSLDARTDALSLIDVYVVEIDKASGTLNTRVDIGGTLGAPTLAGTLQLRNTSIDLYQINLALRELTLDASFDADSLRLEGQSSLGEGVARFNGQLAWREGQPYGNLHVEGERLRVVNVPEAQILASPNLDFRIDGRRIHATGEVRVPYGRLEPADLTTAVLSSGDEVLVGAEPVDPALRWIVASDIRLVLGDDVRLESLGLAARLGGALELRTDAASQVSRGAGELVVSDGRYAALGRLLDIERGRLIYNNVPLNDPAIDLRAQKVFPDAIAGVNVRGSLRAPRLTFYSEPSLPQSQIASLILAGGSIESFSEGQASGAARNDLLAQGGAILAQRVGTQVGVDDVGIESDMENQTSLVLGKYLSDRLYISYGISLAEAINTLKLRWTITDRWTIKTEAGQERAADIVYTLKK